MANSYVEVGWTNSPDTKTAINATNLGHMDGGIAENRELISQLEGQNTALTGRVEALERGGTGGGTSTGTGWTSEQITLLETIGNYLVFSDVATGQAIFDNLIASLRNSSGGGNEEPDEPVNPDVTLTGLNAVYSGGEVAVGTPLTSLTGLKVTATYSDGSTKNVTGYTLSGTIAEGNNTITVSYGGLTDTFSVIGIDAPVVETFTITNSLINVTTDNNATTITSGGSYSATLTPDSNYYIDSVTITMGGINVTDSVYADGVITIPEVTGNVVIIANALESDNLIVLSECTDTGTLPDGTNIADMPLLMTPLIPVTPNTIYKTNITRYYDDTNWYSIQKLAHYDANQNYINAKQWMPNLPMGTINDVEIGDGVHYIRFIFREEYTNPYFGLSGKVVDNGGNEQPDIPDEPDTPDNPTYENLITAEVLAECGAGTLPDGSSFDGVNMLLTPFIAVEPNTTYYSNIQRVLPDGTSIYSQKISRFDADKNTISSGHTDQIGASGTNGLTIHAMNDSTYYVRIGFSAQWTNPYFGKSEVIV